MKKDYRTKKGIARKCFIVLSCQRVQGKRGMVSFESKYDQITTRLKPVLCDQFGKELHPAGCASLCYTIVGILSLLYVYKFVLTYWLT